MSEKKGQANGGLKSDALEVNQQFLSNRTQADSLGINIEKPKFPQYAVAAKRKDSYKNWPAHLNIDPAVMIDAGLVFTGVNDSVRCYHCGGGLRNWEVTDDPWEEHAKWYPSCPHVRLVKGQDYIERVGRGEKPEPDCVPPPQPEKKTDNQLLSTVPAQSCLENGFSEAMVLKAIKIFMENNHGSTEFKAADIAEIILDLDDDGVTDGATSSVDASPVFNCCERRDCGQNCEPRESSQEKDAGQVEQLYLENQHLKENQMCKICLDDVANVIFLPCGHMASCPQCAPVLVKCPLCRLVIEDTVKAYSE